MNEKLKYCEPTLIREPAKLFNKITEEENILSFSYSKNGEHPINWRCKFFTGIIAKTLWNIVPINEEQQGFRKNRPTTDARLH